MRKRKQIKSLKKRVGRLEDRSELAELVAAYGRVVDARDFEALGELYTDDATFDATGPATSGRDAVVAYYQERLSLFGPTYHYPHSQEVTFDSADTASGVVAAHAELAMGGESVWVALHYHDQYVRQGGRWRFRERVVKFLYVLKLSELPTMMGEKLRRRWPNADPEPADLGNF